MSRLSERESGFFDKFWEDRWRPAELQGSLTIPGVPDLEGLRVLICSCGSGREPVLAARAGAEVHAFDISPVAVDKARESARLNGVRVQATVMDFHALQYPAEYFDVVYGSAILHHVHVGQVGSEILRVLKPGGVAFFWENSDRNFILRWARRLVFGSPGNVQRRRVLFLKREGTTDEYPLTEEEVERLKSIFGGNLERVYRRFEFFRMLAYVVSKSGPFARMMDRLDDFVVWSVPAVMPYSFGQGLLMRKARDK